MNIKLRVVQEQSPSPGPSQVSAASQVWHILTIFTVSSASIALFPKVRALPSIYSTVISFRFEPLNAWLEIEVQLAVITMQLSSMLEEPRHVAPGSALISSHASVHTTRHAKPMARTDDLASCSTAARLPQRVNTISHESATLPRESGGVVWPQTLQQRGRWAGGLLAPIWRACTMSARQTCIASRRP